MIRFPFIIFPKVSHFISMIEANDALIKASITGIVTDMISAIERGADVNMKTDLVS